MEDFPSTITHKVSEAGSCEIAQDGKRLISIFQEFSSSYLVINKTLILAGGLGTKLSFYEI